MGREPSAGAAFAADADIGMTGEARWPIYSEGGQSAVDRAMEPN